MPGSYPDPELFANTALQALERAYTESPDAGNSPLILTAMEAIRSLKEEIRRMTIAGDSHFDPHEINESNSAL